MTCKLDAEERAQIREYKKDLEVNCSVCFGTLSWKRPVVPSLEGEYSHVKCALSTCDYQCSKCGMMTDADTCDTYEGYCSECDGKLEPISKRQALKQMRRVVLEEYEPGLYKVDE